MPVECAGCEALREEVRYLRERNTALTDRALAASNPNLHLALTSPQTATGPALTHFEDGLGNQYVQLDGKAVPIRDYNELMKKGGFLDPEGRYVPADEWERAQAKINEMMGGAPPQPM